MFGFLLREARRSFRQHPGLAYTAIVSLTAALTLAGVLLLLTHNATVALERMGDRREMVVYLRDELSQSQRDVLIGRLTDLYGTVRLVSKEEAWQEFARQLGDPELLQAVPDNPLPSSLHITLKPELLPPDAMEGAARQISQFPEVEDVRYGAEWVRRLDRVSSSLFRGSWIILATVALAIVFVLYNTIRLTVLARRPQVEIMSRLGATDGFIAMPFVLEALFEAAFAAALALGIVFGLEQAVAARVTGVVFVTPWMALGFVGAAVACAWLAATLALSRVLRAVGP